LCRCAPSRRGTPRTAADRSRSAAALPDPTAGAPAADGLTYASNRLYERIDYIWLSPELRASSFAVTSSTASDHRGVAATLIR
jgi:endonuclease/exonuclease/phosphatase family metal-dependent hydrolase